MAKEKKTSASKASVPAKKPASVRKKKTSSSQTLKKELMIFSTVVVLIVVLTLGYFLGRSDVSYAAGNEETIVTPKEDNHALLESLEKVKQQRLAMSSKVQKPELQNVHSEQAEKPKLHIEIINPKSAVAEPVKQPAKKSGLEILDEKLHEAQSLPKTIEKTQSNVHIETGKKPKLVIIIDDVASASQLNQIRSLGLKLTPSIFPPYQNAPHNNKLAQRLEHYMIHLPMESGKVFDRQAKTLKTTDTKEQMEARMKEVRTLFPTARFINNHTGSVFTANVHAMEMIYPLFEKEGFIFVDSRTIGKTAVPQIAKKYGQKYLARDTFIDNIQNVGAIHKQLRLAVATAKKRGYAIAIGHPHPTTLAALGSAKEILNDVEVVYIDELYESVK